MPSAKDRLSYGEHLYEDGGYNGGTNIRFKYPGSTQPRYGSQDGGFRRSGYMRGSVNASQFNNSAGHGDAAKSKGRRTRRGGNKEAAGKGVAKETKSSHRTINLRSVTKAREELSKQSEGRTSVDLPLKDTTLKHATSRKAMTSCEDTEARDWEDGKKSSRLKETVTRHEDLETRSLEHGKKSSRRISKVQGGSKEATTNHEDLEARDLENGKKDSCRTLKAHGGSKDVTTSHEDLEAWSLAKGQKGPCHTSKVQDESSKKHDGGASAGLVFKGTNHKHVKSGAATLHRTGIVIQNPENGVETLKRPSEGMRIELESLAPLVEDVSDQPVVRTTNRSLSSTEVISRDSKIQGVARDTPNPSLSNPEGGNKASKRSASCAPDGALVSKQARHEGQIVHRATSSNDDESSSSGDRCWRKTKPQSDEHEVANGVKNGQPLSRIVEDRPTMEEEYQFAFEVDDDLIEGLKDIPLLEGTFSDYPLNGVDDFFASLEEHGEVAVDHEASEDSTESPGQFALVRRRNGTSYQEAAKEHSSQIDGADKGEGLSKYPPPGAVEVVKGPISYDKLELPFIGKAEGSSRIPRPEASVISVFVPGSGVKDVRHKLLRVLWDEIVSKVKDRSLRRLCSTRESIMEILGEMKRFPSDDPLPFKKLIDDFLTGLEVFSAARANSSEGVAQQDLETKLQAILGRLTSAVQREAELNRVVDSCQGEIDNFIAQEVELGRKIEELNREMDKVRAQITSEDDIFSQRKEELKQHKASITSLQEEADQVQKGIDQVKDDSRHLAEVEQLLERARDEIVNFNFRL